MRKGCRFILKQAIDKDVSMKRTSHPIRLRSYSRRFYHIL